MIKAPAAAAMLAALMMMGVPGAMAQTTTTKMADKLTTPPAEDNTPELSEMKSIYDIPVEPMQVDGATTATSLEPYKGKVLLIVNVASNCGFTKQYEGLEKLYQEYKDEGLVVLGFPSNDFRGQEPGTEQEILEFCRGRYGVSFPLFGKIRVTGDDKAPLYKYLTEGDHPAKGEVSWNFNKFLVDRNGNVVAHYESKVTPDDAALVGRLKLLLAQDAE